MTELGDYKRLVEKPMLERMRASHAADKRWLNDLVKAAEAFRMAMIESGATDKVSQDKYFDQLRALESALNPMNYRVEQT